MLLTLLLDTLLVAAAAISTARASLTGSIPGTTSHDARVRGHNYHYYLAEPEDTPKGTILLLHGFPDIAYGWRYQVPALSSLGYRVIVPDMLGYDGTDSPRKLENWKFKELSADMAAFVGQVVPGEQVIVGGHDWGAALAYKLAMWNPEVVKAFFTLSIPYSTPWIGLTTEWADLKDLVANDTYPTLAYQLQWRDPSIVANFTTAEQFRQMVEAIFDGRTPEGKSGFSPFAGWDYDALPRLNPNPLVNETDVEIYVRTFMAQGSRGMYNWYRTRRMNWEDELPIASQGDFKFQTPVLFLSASNDPVVLPQYSESMNEQHFDQLEIREVKGGHWLMQEAPEAVNDALKTWLASLE